MTTVAEHLKTLSPKDRAVIQKVRGVVKKAMPKGYVETIESGMIAYVVPLSVEPKTYNKRPLMYAALARTKGHFAVHLVGLYVKPELHEWFAAEYAKTGKKADFGKGCVRFKTLEDLPLPLVAKAVGKLPMKAFVERMRER